MTDTDKLKRLADELKDVASGKNEHGYLFVSRSEAEAILALHAESERVKEEVDTQRRNASYANQLMDQRVTAMLTRCEERNEAVALLREWDSFSFSNIATSRKTSAFLARIDGKETADDR